MSTEKEIKVLEQIRDTLINEHENMTREDVEYSYDKITGKMTDDSQLWFDERTERYGNYKTSINNIEDIIKEATARFNGRVFN